MFERPRLEILTAQSRDEYMHDREINKQKYADREIYINQLDKSIGNLHTGLCAVCRRRSRFQVARDPLHGTPWWRESFNCQRCGFNTRMRAFIHMYASDLKGKSAYITEQITPLFKWLRTNVGDIVGSEYLGTAPGEVNEQGICNEDLTKLSFESNAFDRILSFEVLEHVPNYRNALREILRCLKPGGKLIMSAPFIWNLPQTLVRAEVLPSGEILHHEPPDYHGNPLDPEGCLCFYYFSFDLLDVLREVGFMNVAVHEYWSKGFVYLGMYNQTYITAEKPKG